MIRTVLADDHTLVRVGIRNTLQTLPEIEIVGEANNGPELLTLLRNFSPNLALIDVTMPDFDPIVMTRQICATYPDLKILIISAYDDIMYVRGLLAAGAHGYHLKDQPLSDLPLAVERVLQGKRWISGPLVDKLIRGENVSPPLVLSARQRDILTLLKQGSTNQEIAERLGLSAKTVENHLTRLYRQLGVRNRVEALVYIGQHPELLAVSGTGVDTCDGGFVPSHVHIGLMIVDDNARYRSHLRQMIARAYEQVYIYEAETVSEALALVRRTTVHLALVDVVLGNQEDGIQCTRRLHALSPTTRIILISAYPDHEFHRRGLEAGACAFLDKKDLDIPSLRQIIQDSIVN